ncbi:ATP-binding cassette domain-containing protein [Vagococcus sp. BWB3-3]|uniref:ATP-binding cassette domain-containing protein n=1 Tax=Vagococcus allomyrinae TaxID=2794353 RepID=A0A940PEP9_9ENTE|nr:ATP-binding cassette domain-containing protein [Vagococcus allomyrinae]MBP1041453.1 ATP-binding cassette domain-containing protein [Vagococcus allomyrinae]
MENQLKAVSLLRTTKLIKAYQEYRAVDEVSMTINQGDIYGFIGKNGAGKTTFIRMLTNLIEKSSGSIEFFSGKENIKIGAVIESPACYPYLSAQANLAYYAIQVDLPDKQERIKEVLEFIGLGDVGEKMFKDFSLGMKQRLGIGLAILNKPNLLILDEPTNGLDPQGIVEIREIIKKLNQQYQTTILVSSHILSELSMIATRYGIIHQGKLVKEVTTQELEHECEKPILLSSVDDQNCQTILKKEGYIVDVAANGLIINAEKSKMPDISRLLFRHQLNLTYFSYKEESLEEYYLKVTR